VTKPWETCAAGETPVSASNNVLGLSRFQVHETPLYFASTIARRSTWLGRLVSAIALKAKNLTALGRYWLRCSIKCSFS